MKTHHLPLLLTLGLVVALAAAIGNATAEHAAAPTADIIARVSVASDGTEGNSHSSPASISTDGRYVAFGSDANNLVPNDTNGKNDIFVHDRTTGETTRVSVAGDGTQGNGSSLLPSISADGHFIAFRSNAGNLVPGDTNGASDIFVHDRTTGQTSRVSVASDGSQASATGAPSISGDGRYVAFVSLAGNLAPGDTNDAYDIFVHDRTTGETARVSIASSEAQANSHSFEPNISADGRYVAFRSYASNLAPGDTNGATDIFVHDRAKGTTSRVSIASDGAQGNGDSFAPGLAADGRFVAFASYASNLVPNDTNGANGEGDVFVHDRATGETTRVSVASDGTQANGDSASAGVIPVGISADGYYVAFFSLASNLVPGDTNDVYDIFVHDRITGETSRVSVASDGTQGNSDSVSASIASGGRYVAFSSEASNLVAGDTNDRWDVFAYDRARGYGLALSADAAQTVEPDTNVVYTLTLTNTGALSDTIALTLSGGAWPAFIDGPTTVALAAGASHTLTVVVSIPAGADGASEVVTLAARSQNNPGLGDAADLTTTVPRNYGVNLSTNEARTLAPGTNLTYTLALSNTGALPDTYDLTLSSASWPTFIDGSTTVALASGEGRVVTVVVAVPLRTVTGDSDSVALTAASQANPSITDTAYLTTTVSGVTSRVSVASDGTQADDTAWYPSISGDGRYVAFYARASNLVPGDTNGQEDVFVHDQRTGQTIRVSVASDGAQGNGRSQHPSISGDGRFVAFQSEADNLAPGDTNGVRDVFVHDRATGETTRVSVDSAGAQANGISMVPTISADGRFVTFQSHASNLTPGDTNDAWDIFVHDRATGVTKRASIGSDGAQANGDSSNPAISADSRYVVFHSQASNLVPGDTNGEEDVFVHDRATGETTRVAVASDGTQGNGSSRSAAISADGRFVAFRSWASNLVPGDSNTCYWDEWPYNCADIFVHDRATGETTRVSVASDGAQGNDDAQDEISISGGGRYVAFASWASNLVPGDTYLGLDVFVHDRATGQTGRVSVASDGAQADSGSGNPSISADGRYVAFHSLAGNLASDDTNSAYDIFVHDRHGGYDWSYLPLISTP